MGETQQLCRGKSDPTAPHDLTAPNALTNAGWCRACKRYADRLKEQRRKAKVAERRGVNVPRTQCGGTQDPSAPHDLTLPDAVTAQGKCRECRRFAQKASRAAAKKRVADSLLSDAAVSPVPDDLDQGVPAYPRGPGGSYRASQGVQFPAGDPRWAEADAGALAAFADLFEPWPAEGAHEGPEDDLGDYTDLEILDAIRAMGDLSQDRSQTDYTRQLAWRAFLAARRERAKRRKEN